MSSQMLIEKAKTVLCLNVSRRYFVASLAFIGFCCVYSMRVNLSIALLEMTKEGGEFQMTELKKGAALSAFFYGYIVTQIPGGFLAARYSGKLVFGIGVMLCSILTLLTPLMAPLGSGPLIFLRVLQGLSQGVAYPAMLAVWSRWAPQYEKTKLTTLTFSGSYFGTVIAQPLAGLLGDSLGWKAIFIFFGIVSLLWSVAWLTLVSSDPSHDKHITSDELQLIQNTTAISEEQSKHLKAPWRAMMTSPAVWAIATAHMAENWGFYTMLTELPQFIKDVEDNNSLPGDKFQLQRASVLAAIPYLVMALAIQFGGWLADHLRDKRQMNTLFVRKLFNCAAFGAQAFFIVITAYTRTPGVTIFCVSLAVGCGGFAWSGFSVNPLDIAPQFASHVMGISNTIATLPGMISPVITSSIVSEHRLSQWEGVFWLSAVIYLFGAVVFAALAQAEKQPWAELPEGYLPHTDEAETPGGTVRSIPGDPHEID